MVGADRSLRRLQRISGWEDAARRRVFCSRGIALVVFFVVNAVIGNGRFYGNVLFAIVALGLAIRSFRRVGDAKRNAKN